MEFTKRKKKAKENEEKHGPVQVATASALMSMLFPRAPDQSPPVHIARGCICHTIHDTEQSIWLWGKTSCSFMCPFLHELQNEPSSISMVSDRLERDRSHSISGPPQGIPFPWFLIFISCFYFLFFFFYHGLKLAVAERRNPNRFFVLAEKLPSPRTEVGTCRERESA